MSDLDKETTAKILLALERIAHQLKRFREALETSTSAFVVMNQTAQELAKSLPDDMDDLCDWMPRPGYPPLRDALCPRCTRPYWATPHVLKGASTG